MSIPASARSRWEELVAQVNEARARYYQSDRPTLADEEYDALYRELVELENSHPELASGESPTQTVGGERSEMFEPVEHLERMYSLDNVFDDGELTSWFERVVKGIGSLPPMLCELKIDGLAVDAVYTNGLLTSLATRGDGRVGEDVTANAAHIPAIPQALTGRSVPELIEVRGEIFFTVNDFTTINAEQLESGLPTFANPRNAAAGTLRQRVDKRLTDLREAENLGARRAETLRTDVERALRRLSLLRLTVHGIGATRGLTITRQSDGYSMLASLGLPVSDRMDVRDSIDGVRDYITLYGEHRHDVEHEIDGVVVTTINNRVWVPTDLRQRIVKWYHNNLQHAGVTHMINTI